MKFEIHGEIVGEIAGITTIAEGDGIHILERLVQLHGEGNWRKLKGFATVQFEDGTIAEAEIHWFEADGIGRRRMKIKRILY